MSRRGHSAARANPPAQVHSFDYVRPADDDPAFPAGRQIDPNWREYADREHAAFAALDAAMPKPKPDTTEQQLANALAEIERLTRLCRTHGLLV